MRLSLKYLIALVALLSVILTMTASIISGYRAEQQSLIESTLETNQAYAEKMAITTDGFLSSTLQSLKISGKYLSSYMSSEYVDDYLIPEADRMREQTNTFNSVSIVDKEGQILATSPQTLDLMGKELDSIGGKQALKKREPYISQPYVGLTNRLIIFISSPIVDENGRYLGLIGGTIYLKEDNILQEVLGEHFYENGSYVYVVDQSGRIIYHQNHDRVNDIVLENPVVKQIQLGKSGAMEVVNTEGIEMLAGYSPIPLTNWGVVTQRSKKESLAPSITMIKEMAKMTVPFIIISLLVILYIAHQIANPLTKLASYAESSTENNQEEKINKVRAWYYEAIQLKKALNYSLNFFQDRVNFFIHQSTIDPLTKLKNRRAMDAYLKEWTEQETPYAVLIFDIDKFKRINDTYGHSVGDEVLKYLAESMHYVTRKDDVCCRFGGEEFVILLPETDQKAAFQIAERLRKKLESTVSPCGEVVTISIGIATCPQDGTHPAELLELADQCLYEAKRTGRNRTVECATLMK